MSSAEAREMAADNPLSFLHVSKPEIDLPPATDIYAPEVYDKGRENFQKLISRGALVQDDQPCFYLYRQVMGKHSQVGLVGASSCKDYLQNVIKKHEFTRPDKEDDRVRHIETLNSQTGPVFLTYRSTATLDQLIKKKTAENPDIDFAAKDSVRHTAWVISDAKTIELIEAEFANIPALYIADGHHRSAAAARVYQARKGAGHSSHFLSVIFPHDQMQILPYNRVLKDLNGHAPENLLEKIRFQSPQIAISGHGDPKPAQKGRVCLYLQGTWSTISVYPKVKHKDEIENLDVTLLQKQILGPVFGIDDPRTSKRINFVGGIRGTGELEKLVDSGEYSCAFSMFPTSIEDLMAIADSGGIMPPKSTWFEPKLRDAMFCHMI